MMLRPQAGLLPCISGSHIAVLSAQLGSEFLPVSPNVLVGRRDFAALFLHPKFMGDE